MSSKFETVVILDFGGQYTQLIGRRIREANVYTEIVPFNTPAEQIKTQHPKGVILSGGPASVYEAGAPTSDPAIFKIGVPILGICYGMKRRLWAFISPVIRFVNMLSKIGRAHV